MSLLESKGKGIIHFIDDEDETYQKKPKEKCFICEKEAKLNNHHVLYFPEKDYE